LGDLAQPPPKGHRIFEAVQVGAILLGFLATVVELLVFAAPVVALVALVAAVALVALVPVLPLVPLLALTPFVTLLPLLALAPKALPRIPPTEGQPTA